MEVLLMNRPTDHVCKTRTLLALILCMWVSMQVMAGTENATHLSARPSSLNIGALFTFNSVIGRAAKPAILAAIDDVNSDQSILRGTNLTLILHDTNCSGFLGTVEDSPLAIDISSAILKLSKSGTLQKIHEKWFCKMGCRSDKNLDSDESNQLHLMSFWVDSQHWGLYLLCGAFTLAALVIFPLRVIHQFVRYKKQRANNLSSSLSSTSWSSRWSQVMGSFVDFITEKEECTLRVTVLKVMLADKYLDHKRTSLLMLVQF
ncbi:hypothetical protein ACFX13_046408 [Malus domestica]